MYLVVVTELRDSHDAELAELAKIFGLAPYDVRVRLNFGLPRVLLSLQDERRAMDLADEVRARGHSAFAGAVADYFVRDQMVTLHRFHMDDRSLVSDGKPPAVLPFSEVAAVIPVAVRTNVVRTSDLRMSEDVRGDPDAMSHIPVRTTSSDHVETHVAYLFPSGPRREKPPWVIDEGTVQWIGLGRHMRPTRHENFLTMLSLLRERSRGAIVDERFLQRHQTVSGLLQVREHESVVPKTGSAEIDLTVQVLAETLTESKVTPYRG